MVMGNINGLPASTSAEGSLPVQMNGGAASGRGSEVENDERADDNVSPQHRHCGDDGAGGAPGTAPLNNTEHLESAAAGSKVAVDPASTHKGGDAKLPVGSLSSVGTKSTTRHFTLNSKEVQSKQCTTTKEAQPVKNKYTKKVSLSPSNMATEQKSTLHIANSEAKSQLKSPPELKSPAAMSTSKSPQSLNSRWIPPAVTGVSQGPSLSSLPLQSKLALTNSWLDGLNKQQTKYSPTTGQKVKSKDGGASKTNLQKSSAEHASAKRRSPVITNLEESYFKRPNRNNNIASMPGNRSEAEAKNDRVIFNLPQQFKPVKNDRGDTIKGYLQSGSQQEEDTLSVASEATRHHSNKSNKKNDQHSQSSKQRTLFFGVKKQSNNESNKTSYEDEVMARVLAASKNEKSPQSHPKSEADFEADLLRALEESAKMQSRSTPHTPQVIDLLDSDDEENVKMPAQVKGNINKGELPASTAIGASSIEEDEEALLKLAIEQSLKSAKEEAKSSEIIHQTCRKLSRIDFEVAVDAFVQQQGGYERLENNEMVKHGNANDMKKSRMVEGGGQNQTGAQYGRYSILRMWRIFDVIEGKEDINIDEPYAEVKSPSPSKSAPVTKGGKKRDKQELEVKNRLEGLPGAKIKAFVDIGHGIGIQVLQAGWSIGVPARGVEIMKDRHLIADQIREGVLESLRTDPPDSTKVELKLADFSHAMIPDKKTKERDENLRSFLLFEDLSMEIQKGLVIFINNAEEVFAARSNQKVGGACLDSYLAKMFANMQIGGRMVTLTDVSCHLTNSSEWFRHDVFQSGTNAVSWGGWKKSIPVYVLTIRPWVGRIVCHLALYSFTLLYVSANSPHSFTLLNGRYVLTKLSNEWYCQNNKCVFKQFGSDAAAPNNVVDGVGELCEHCVFCSAPAKKCMRFRKPSSKLRKKEG